MRPLTQSERRLVESYLPLARMMAGTLGARYHRRDQDDLLSDAYWGLMDAATRYDATKGASFKTHAEHRITGAVLDGMRKRADLKRRDQEAAITIERTSYGLASRTGRNPSSRQVAQELGMTPRQLSTLLADIQRGQPLRIDGWTPQEEEYWQEVLPDHRLEHELQLVEEFDFVDPLLADLNWRERFLILLYYWQGLTLLEIANLLNVTESRVSQVHIAALNKLRKDGRVQEAA